MPKFNNTDILGDLRVTGETIIEEPTKPNHAATKQYVDNMDPLSEDDERITNWNDAYTHSQSDHAPANAQKNVQSDWNATEGDAFIKNKPTTFPPIIGSTATTAVAGNDSRLTNSRPASDVSTWAKASTKPNYSWDEIDNKPTLATKSWVEGKEYVNSSEVSLTIQNALSSVMTYKGTKSEYKDLPTSGNAEGDFWNVTDTGINYAWDGSNWDKIGGVTDLSGLVPTTRKVNDKQLNADISLTASDVGARASDWKPTWGDVTGKPTTFTPAAHTHHYLPLSGGTMAGAIDFRIGYDTDFITLTDPTLNKERLKITRINGGLKLDIMNAESTISILPSYINLTGGMKITGLGTPTADSHAATKKYVDNHLPLTGGTLTGPLTINNNSYDHINLIRGSGQAAIKYTSNEGGGVYIAVPDSSATADAGSLGWIKPTSGTKYSLYVGGNSHANAAGKVIAKELYEGNERVSTLTPTNIYIDGGNL